MSIVPLRTLIYHYQTAVNYILATFRIIVAGLDKDLTKWQESVISTAIRRVYENAGVTNDKETWYRSKGLRINQVYEEIYDMVVRQEFAMSNIFTIVGYLRTYIGYTKLLQC